MKGVDDLVKGRSSSTFLFKVNQTEIGMMAMLQDGEEFGGEFNWFKTKDCDKD